MEALDALSKGEVTGAHARCAGGAQAVGRHDGRHLQPRLLRRYQQWTLISTRWSPLDGLLSKFELEGETVEVKLSAEEKLLRARKQSWGDRTWQFETVNITSSSRLQGRLEETAADLVLFQDRWTVLRPPEQRSRSRKKGWDVTLSPAQREV